MSEMDLLEQFRADLAAAKIQDRYQYDLYERQGIDQLKVFLADCTHTPQPDVLHTEQFFEVTIGRTCVAGRIDRIDKLEDGTVVITDYKTGKPQSQEDADKSLQLSVYALAAQEKWGYEIDHLVLYNLAENTSVAAKRTAAQLEEARHKVEEVAGKVADGQFEPKTGFHCRFCAYRSLCPATEKRFDAATGANKNSRN
jgi:RecB family exonuclease